MNQAERIAEMFGNDGMNFILRGEFLSETKTLIEGDAPFTWESNQ